MHVEDIMTPRPACARAGTLIPEIARLMVERDCGEIPVLDHDGRPVGVITDRDICCRIVATGRSPDETTAEMIMSTPCVVVARDASLEDCVKILEAAQIRRAPVVDEEGRCCGMVSQADIARSASEEDTGELVRAVSLPAPSISTWG